MKMRNGKLAFRSYPKSVDPSELTYEGLPASIHQNELLSVSSDICMKVDNYHNTVKNLDFMPLVVLITKKLHTYCSTIESD